jgi:predicted nucleic acid-binding protein
MEQRLLADSNTIIDYVGNRLPEQSASWLDSHLNKVFSVSIISKIEVLGFNAENDDLLQLSSFIQLGKLIELDELIADKTIELRRKKKIKLPDAIIAASAIIHELALVTHNRTDFKNIDGLVLIDPYEIEVN